VLACERRLLAAFPYSYASDLDGLDALGVGQQQLAFAITAKLRDLKAHLDQMQQLLEQGQANKAGARLKNVRDELQSWINASEPETPKINVRL
jgi:hypothetical protein